MDTTGLSIITGSSVHNQRIERLWRDVFRCVSYQFRNIFFYMEEGNILDPLSELHLFCLHYVYFPHINRALTEFAEQWNLHPISTEEIKVHTNFGLVACWHQPIHFSQQFVI